MIFCATVHRKLHHRRLRAANAVLRLDVNVKLAADVGARELGDFEVTFGAPCAHEPVFIPELLHEFEHHETDVLDRVCHDLPATATLCHGLLQSEIAAAGCEPACGLPPLTSDWPARSLISSSHGHACLG